MKLLIVYWRQWPTFNRQTESLASLLFTDVPELVNVSVVATIGSSDHSTLSISLDIRQSIPKFVIRREVFMKSRANWDTIS